MVLGSDGWVISEFPVSGGGEGGGESSSLIVGGVGR
jgi:hypothetical protein